MLTAASIATIINLTTEDKIELWGGKGLSIDDAIHIVHAGLLNDIHTLENKIIHVGCYFESWHSWKKIRSELIMQDDQIYERAILRYHETAEGPEKQLEIYFNITTCFGKQPIMPSFDQ